MSFGKCKKTNNLIKTSELLLQFHQLSRNYPKSDKKDKELIILLELKAKADVLEVKMQLQFNDAETAAYNEINEAL
jgi:hypothetical protein